MFVKIGQKGSIVGNDQRHRMKTLWKSVKRMTGEEIGVRAVKPVADVLQVINDRADGAEALLTAYRASRIPGSELVFTLEDGSRFLRDFAGVQGVDCVKLAGEAPDGSHWPICDGGLSYKQLAVLSQKVPCWTHTPNQIRSVDASKDTRAPDRKCVLWTPAALEATKACPKLVVVSYRQLWGRADVVTLREQIILALQIYWKHSVWLDPVGWTRTSSRNVDGQGMRVVGSDGRLYVCWYFPACANPLGGPRSAIS